MTNNASSLENEPSIEEIETNLLNLESKREKLATVDAELAEWYAEQQFNIFGYTIKHLDEQLKAATLAKDSYKGIQEIQIPQDSERIALRKTFHSRVLQSLRFNITWPSILILLPFFFDFLDRINLLSPLGPLTYPFVAAIFLTVALLFIGLRTFFARKKWNKANSSSEPKIRDIVQQGKLDNVQNEVFQPVVSKPTLKTEKKEARKLARQKQGPWPTSKVLKWVSGSLLLATLIFFWPVAGNFAKIIYKAPFFPSGWQVLLAALGIFVTRFLFALASYYRGYVNFENSLKTAVAEVEFARGRAFKIRKSIQRFELLINEFFWWNKVMGIHLRQPWLIEDSSSGKGSRKSLGESFPKSLLLAHALDDSAQDELARIKYENYRVSIYDEETRRGWRQRNFEKFYETDEVLGKYVVDGKRLSESIAKSTLQPNTPYGAVLAELLTNEEYLKHIGEEKQEIHLKKTQKSILSDGGLHVEVDQPGLTEPLIRTWDDHLKVIVKSPLTNDFVRSVMTIWGLTTEAHTEGHNKDVKTYVSGPRGLIERMKLELGDEGSKSVVWRAGDNDEIRVVDLLQRVDLLFLPIESVRLPRAI